MQWTQTTDPKRRCPMWVPASHTKNVAATSELEKKAKEADLAFRQAKRKREPPKTLKVLKAAVAKLQGAADKARKATVAKGVYVLGRPHGFVVMKHSTGSKIHSKHAKLNEAQAAAVKLIK